MANEAIETASIEEDFKDLLNRRAQAKNFLKVVQSCDAKVYSINARWGAGKSWFLKYIEDECISLDVPFLQFNVWETDYANNPFLAIVPEILELIKKT